MVIQTPNSNSFHLKRALFKKVIYLMHQIKIILLQIKNLGCKHKFKYIITLIIIKEILKIQKIIYLMSFTPFWVGKLV